MHRHPNGQFVKSGKRAVTKTYKQWANLMYRKLALKELGKLESRIVRYC